MDKNRYLIDLSESDRTSFGRVEFTEQVEEQKIFSAIWALESQVNNGGFLQYFGSWDGDTATFASHALRRIGADDCAAIVDEALTAVAHPLPNDYEKRSEIIDALGPEVKSRLEALDSRFYSYPNDLTSLLFAFVSSNPRVFGHVPLHLAG